MNFVGLRAITLLRQYHNTTIFAIILTLRVKRCVRKGRREGGGGQKESWFIFSFIILARDRGQNC